MAPSWKANREMGVLLEADEEPYRDAVAEVQSIIAAAATAQRARTADPLPPRGEPSPRAADFARRHRARGRGSCIRCARRIPFDPTRPLCDDCYDVWAAYGNPDYIEQVCHACRRPEATSMRRPLCLECYRELSAP